MGIFNFGKKKDPLDELDFNLKGDSNFDIHKDATSGENGFSDSYNKEGFNNNSANPNSMNMDSSAVKDTASSFSDDPFSQYQQAVNSAKDSFHSNDVSNSYSKDEPRSYSNEKVSHSTELILSKLDVLKAMIENLNHRMENLEQKYAYDQEKRKRSW